MIGRRPITRSLHAVALAFAVLTMNAVPVFAQAGAGQTFTVPVQARGSARAAFRQAIASLPGMTSVQLRAALSDKQDTFVQGSFTAMSHGVPVTGLVMAGRTGVAAGAFDTPDRAGRTVPALLAQLAATMTGGGASAAVPLRTVSFGSGTIGLPPAWQVLNSYQGCVEAGSQQDHGYLAFGCPQAVLTPPTLPGVNPRTVLVLPYGDPVAVLRAVMEYPGPAGLGVQGFRVLEAQAVQPAVAGGRAAYVLFDYSANGQSYRGLALSSVAPFDAHSYMLYKSMFMLPSSSFARLAPTMWKSWQSWGVSSGVLTGRLMAAAQSMRETGDIITGAYWDRQHANDRVSLGFSQSIRETAQLEDVQTGRRYNGSYFDAAAIVAHDPVKYRIVPVSELIP